MKNLPILLIALGGNALIKKGQVGTAEEQLENLIHPMKQIALLAGKYNIVITHGNGPQVGNLLLQQEACSRVPRMPLEIIGAMTQGQIGYMIESSLDTALMEEGIEDKYFVTLITYVVVDENDPQLKHPSKPIGPIYTCEEAERLPYTMKETDKGFRRVVASPGPVTIVEHREIKKLIHEGFIVICCGGGGIPVVRKGRRFSGIEAVIDKDLASFVLARDIVADIFIIATDVPGAVLYRGTPKEKRLGKISLAEMKRHMAEGHFPAGSMGPKVEALVRFVEATGNRGVICDLADIVGAAAGTAGTEIIL
ncbi:MAG: carbamate kinase [Desulfobacterales bacterium]|jgi:carbamate kinase|nr:carbamate kinase [Desulfobacterales bacterium]